MTDQGQFVWYELMTTDMPGAEAFYRAVVGWGARDAGIAQLPYTLLEAGERPVAGIMTLDDEARAAGARPIWAGFVHVDDVDACAARVKADGGRIYSEPMEAADIGRFCMVADPQGAPLVLFKGVAGGPPAPVVSHQPGHVGWHELFTPDSARALTWYGDLFGWTPDIEMDMGPMGQYRLFAAGGPAIGGMLDQPDQLPRPIWLFYFGVDSIQAAIERLEAHGGKVAMGPHEVPGGLWIVQAFDPQGAWFALISANA